MAVEAQDVTVEVLAGASNPTAYVQEATIEVLWTDLAISTSPVARIDGVEAADLVRIDGEALADLSTIDGTP